MLFGKNVFNNSAKIEYFVFPEYVKDASLIDTQALNNSHIKTLCFTGMNMSSSLKSKLQSTQVFGLKKDCYIITNDNKQYQYVNSSKTVQEYCLFNLNSSIGTLKSVSDPKFKIKLGRFSWFRKDIVEFCISRHIPFFVFYFDSLTSPRTQYFIQNFLMQSSVRKELKTMKCPFLMLDRNKDDSSSQILYYKGEFRDQIQSSLSKYGSEQVFDLNGGFVNMLCFYENSSSIYVKSESYLYDALKYVKNCYSNGNLDSFDDTEYRETYDVPEDEDIGSDSPNKGTLWSSKSPWWYSGSSIKSIPSIDFSKNYINFRNIFSPEECYCALLSYDMSYHTITGIDVVNNIMKYFCDTIVRYSEKTGDAIPKSGTFCSELEKGIKYKYFFFYEFSHGNTELISIDGGNYVYRSQVWDILKNSSNRVFGMFDSCYSGSMIKESSTKDGTSFTMWSSAPVNRSCLYYTSGGKSFFTESLEKFFDKDNPYRIEKMFELVQKDCDEKNKDSGYGDKVGPPDKAYYGPDVSQHFTFY